MIAGIAYSILAALGDLLGGWLVIGRLANDTLAHRHRQLSVLIAFGGGFMLAVAFLEMVPAALGMTGGVTAVLIGYLVVHLTQHTLTPHFHFGEETHSEAMVSRDVGVWALAGLLPHSFFDGVAISSGFLTSNTLGTLLFGAVLLHKVPTGASLASIMLASGNSARSALLAVALLAAATVMGALLTPSLGLLARFGLALSAGVTIYVAASNLIPEAQRERGFIIPGSVFLGVLAFYLVRLLLPDA
ncbi:MAG: ZIP family metal transporter [Longimicrobiales bacterium]